MGEVLHFPPKGIHKRPVLTGEAICLNCKEEWVATAPVGIRELECPRCRTFKGLFRFPYEVTNLYWVCDCGNKYFLIAKGGIFCPNCGELQRGM